MSLLKMVSRLSKTRLGRQVGFCPANQAQRRQARKSRSLPGLERLEDRTTPAGNLTLTNAVLVDANNVAIAAPVKGEMVFIRAEWTSQGLGAGDTYRISYSVDGD